MNYEKFKNQYVNKQELLLALWEQQKYGSPQDSRGRAKAMMTIMNFPYIENIQNKGVYKNEVDGK